MYIKRDDLLKGIENNLKDILENKGKDTKFVTKVLIEEFLKALTMTVEDMQFYAAENKESIETSLFNTKLKVVFKPLHKARNPKNGEEIEVDDRVQIMLRSKPKSVKKILQ